MDFVCTFNFEEAFDTFRTICISFYFFYLARASKTFPLSVSSSTETRRQKTAPSELIFLLFWYFSERNERAAKSLLDADSKEIVCWENLLIVVT